MGLESRRRQKIDDLVFAAERQPVAVRSTEESALFGDLLERARAQLHPAICSKGIDAVIGQLERRRPSPVDALQHAGVDQVDAITEARRDLGALLRSVADDESLDPVAAQNVVDQLSAFLLGEPSKAPKPQWARLRDQEPVAKVDAALENADRRPELVGDVVGAAASRCLSTSSSASPSRAMTLGSVIGCTTPS